MPEISTAYNVNPNTINTLSRPCGIKPSTFAVFGNLPDVATFDAYGNQGQKVTFKEGTKIFFQGAKERMKDLGKEIKKHPIRTALVAGGTMAALSLLPLVGITVGAGSALIAGAIALKTGFSMIKDVVNINKYRKSGDNSALRNYIKKLGGDSFDMLLVAPVVPKGIKQLSSQIKAGEAFKINSELLAKIKTQNVGASAGDLITTNADILLKQAGEKVPLPIKILSKLKPTMNKEFGATVYNVGDSLFQSIGGTVSSGVILAKMAKEFGLDDKYCEKTEERFNEAVSNSNAAKIAEIVAKPNSLDSINT